VVIEPRLAGILATALLDLADRAAAGRNTIIAKPVVYAGERDGDGE
jgi:hypothetical protein